MSIKSLMKKNMNRINHWKNAATDFRPKLIVLLYHRVLPEFKKNKLNVVVSSATFEKQVDRLSRKYRIMPLRDATSESGADKTRIALTFDDGYWDNYEIVFPILKKKGILAAFFIAVDYVDGKAVFTDRRVIDKKTGEPYDVIKDRFISWDQVRKMSEAGMEIGSHGISHDSLAQMPSDEALREISGSKKIIEERTGKACNYFSFPFGSRADYSEALIRHVKGSGFKGCMLNVRGYNHIRPDSFCFKRVIMDEYTDISYLLG